MRDIILIYNPKAGDTYFRFSLDRFIEIFSEKGYEIRVFRSRMLGDMAEYLKGCDLSLTQAVFVAGGNGTINEVVNAMMEIESQIPLGVIPAGTDNEFAKSLGFGENLEENLLALSRMVPTTVDVGKVNGRYFVNVCSAGAFSALSSVSSDMKNTFGRWAYYFKGIGSLTKIRRMRLHIEADGAEYEDQYVLFMLINAKMRRADENVTLQELTDGQYDLIAVKKGGLTNLARVLVKVFRHEPVHENDILHVKASHFKIAVVDSKEPVQTELDGEPGVELPIEVTVCRGALNFFINEVNVPRGTSTK